MERVDVDLGNRSYPIHIGPNLLRDSELLAGIVPARQILVVTNDVVAPLYLEPLRKAFEDRELNVVVLPDGERYKTLDSFSKIIDELIDRNFHRDACIVALGGGVVGDVAGFAAACYQRGIDFLQVPTTLLAQVDSSVGGKTAVNHPRAKNMIGAFYQPIGVVADTETLRTLPPRELSAGLAEVVKYGLILDIDLFEWLEEHMEALLELDPAALAHAIRRSCEIKAAIVAEDEQERGSRALLNLGHTFGHALESIGRYETWLHGEAVAIGISLAASTSRELGWLEAGDCERIDALLRRARLPVAAPGIDTEDMLSHMSRDKKASMKGLRLVLLERIGRGTVIPSPEVSVLRKVLVRHSA